MHQQQHYTLFKIKKVKLQSTTPFGVFNFLNVTFNQFNASFLE